MEKVTLEATTFEESLKDIHRIMGKMESATIGQLRNATIGLCENIVQLTAIWPDEDSFMIATLSILEAALDENREDAPRPLQQYLVNWQRGRS